MVKVVLYGKPGCHLCDDARAVVSEALAGRDVDLEEVDVTLDPALERRYGERIPVLTVDGEELFEYFVDGRVLAERLRRSASDRLGRARRDR
jgi:glutaredoxin